MHHVKRKDWTNAYIVEMHTAMKSVCFTEIKHLVWFSLYQRYRFKLHLMIRLFIWYVGLVSVRSFIFIVDTRRTPYSYSTAHCRGKRHNCCCGCQNTSISWQCTVSEWRTEANGVKWTEWMVGGHDDDVLVDVFARCEMQRAVTCAL